MDGDEWTLVRATVYVRRSDPQQAADRLHEAIQTLDGYETDFDVVEVWPDSN